MHQEVKLVSKRNFVSRIVNKDITYISKTFASLEDFKHECEVLDVLKKAGVNVPNILEISGQKILLEDLGDYTLLSWYENLEKQNSYNYDDIIYNLCSWLRNFYKATKSHFNHSYIINDVNIRNFMIKNNEIYGVDFELSCYGNIEVDAGKLAAYALTYNPAMTEWKIRFRDKFIKVLSEQLSINIELIIKEEKKELQEIKKRRNNL